ncbi:MAG: universal stress protein [Planctomycetales bacterium]|nr:universal stress protein [Planctomycetales bacterium]
MKRFKKLLVYTGSSPDETLINRSVVLAMENDASLTWIDVIKPIPRSLRFITGGTDPKELERLLVEEHRRKLVELAGDLFDDEVPIEVVVRTGDPATEIIREVVDHGHDLVIKTADNFGTSEQLFGGVARSLIRMCPCAVLLLKSAVHGDFDQVVVPLDVEAVDESHQSLNRSIAEIATEIARADDASLHLIAVWDFPMEAPFRQRSGDAEVDHAIEQHEAALRAKIHQLFPKTDHSIRTPEVHLRRGSAAKAIIELVQEVQADLLVMGTVCRTGLAGFLIGNTAETVLVDATCSVLALKPDGFVSPISEAVEAETSVL